MPRVSASAKSQDQTPAPTQAAQAVWNLTASTTLVNSLAVEKLEGRMSNNGWKKSSWQSVASAVTAAVNHSFTISQCKSHWQLLRTRYKVCRELRSLSGFGWDEENYRVTATDEVWEDYIKAHPKAAWFRQNSFPHYDVIAYISDDNLATGELALAIGHLPPSPDAEGGPDENVEDSDRSDDDDNDNSGSQTTTQSTNDSSVSPSPSPRTPPASLPKTRVKTDDELNWQSATSSLKTASSSKRRNRGSHLDALSNSLQLVAAAIAPPPPQPNPDVMGTPRRKLAWQKILEQENLSPRELAFARRVFRQQPELAVEYLSFPPEQDEARRIWLQGEIERVMSV